MAKPTLNLQDEYGLFINGEFVPAEGGKTRDAYSPADGSKLATFADGSKGDVDRAVQAAKVAFEEFRTWNNHQRADLLNQIADIIDKNKEHLAQVETMDNGKPIRETMEVDVPDSADHFRFFAGLIKTDQGTVRKIDNNMLSMVLREPIGVVGQIIPWNFPLLMAAWKLAPALAAGDTIVIKPSSSTSLSLLELARLTKDIIPAGVLNVVTGGGGTTGEYILEHPDIKKLAFTGSTEIGYNVYKHAAERMVPATLELGGKSANIIFEDADIDLALDGAAKGILFNQGQVCSAGSRLFVQESIYDQFVDRLTDTFEQVKVGMPWEEDTQVGAQVNENQSKKVAGYMDIAKEEGATIAAGGHRLTEGKFEQGYYFEPTLITDVDNHSRLAQEEIFGPVLTVIKFKDEADAIKMANDSDYGLAGAVFTQDISRALRVSQAMATGRVWINTYNVLPAGAPFGGYKESGVGRENDERALDAYSQVKNIMIDISNQPSGLYDIQ
ncbi:MAG: aldehyde dehydrogenase family protein [Aerococcus sp.]|nr:aldehyde dehydrogenase family protein [Aerococcus sp.]